MGEGPATVRVRHRKTRYYTAIAAAAVLGAGVAVGTTVAGANAAPNTAGSAAVPETSPAGSLTITPPTTTPIKHLVVIFGENVSFDHYFGTYPFAANTDGTAFHAKGGTPRVNGLYTKITPSGPAGPLLTDNPNTAEPARLGPSQALTCDQDHAYTAEQQAVDGGKMDKFVQFTEGSGCAPNSGVVMDYYDGNTVTGLWNYAQHYAMSDNNWDTTFGPSTPGALNLISGNDSPGYSVSASTGAKVADPGTVSALNSSGLGTIYGDLDPAYDDCSDGSSRTSTAFPLGVMTGPNIGNLLNAKGITWGWFQGGFAPTGTSGGLAVCGTSHKNVGGATITDYSPHHEPFQYFKSTANPKHLPPSSEAAVGRTDRANHQYDLSWFGKTITAGNMPAVSFLKAAEYQDGHAGYSDPLDEQTFLVNTINEIEQSKYWSSTAIVVTYDDSDGWYDHQAPKIVNGSNAAQDTAICSSAPMTLGSYPDRCGYSQRLPMLVISPWTKANHVSSSPTDTTSILKFVENNWLGGKRIGGGSFDAIAGRMDSPNGLFNWFAPHFTPVMLDPATGAVVKH